MSQDLPAHIHPPHPHTTHFRVSSTGHCLCTPRHWMLYHFLCHTAGCVFSITPRLLDHAVFLPMDEVSLRRDPLSIARCAGCRLGFRLDSVLSIYILRYRCWSCNCWNSRDRECGNCGMEREDGVDCGWGWWVQEVNGQDEWVVDIDDVEIEQGLRGRDVRKVGVSVDYGFKFG